ncbi:MAG TPA: ABC transporter ATP-binding protein [candidate division Zixibacteria bacterium]|nr:ABC transporter ATP-binding protein [candidate division Zixibacteria bacterium]
MEEKRSEKELILEVKDLHTYFYGEENIVWKILEGINFKIYKGETLGILGPSGVGKSVLAQSIFNLVRRPGKIVQGEIIFKGKNLLEMEEEELIDIRGRDLALVMQNTGSSFDPLTDMTFTTSQPFRAHTDEDYIKSEIKLLVIDQLGKVAIPDPITTSDKYAHQISGGEGQRIKIASAVINNPSLLIADEPVSNLDITVARSILDLLFEMKQKFNLTMILIAHNLGVIAELSDYVAIMYAGKIVEIGDVESIFYNPKHPFTQGLFYATPSMAPRGKLKPIKGIESDPRNFPKGCHFHPRCEYAIEKCNLEEPKLEQCNNERHLLACWRMKEIPDFVSQE